MSIPIPIFVLLKYRVERGGYRFSSFFLSFHSYFDHQKCIWASGVVGSKPRATDMHSKKWLVSAAENSTAVGIPYLSTFDFPISGDFTGFAVAAFFTEFYVIPILATRGQVGRFCLGLGHLLF